MFAALGHINLKISLGNGISYMTGFG